VFLAAAGLVLAGGAAYAHTLAAPFVFDDLPTIVDNPTIRHVAAALLPGRGMTASGRPILNLSLALNYAAGGLGVRGYHFANLLIHLAAALALFGLLRRTWERRGEPRAAALAFAVALLWTVHPLQTEAVTYVSQRAESLMALFYLLTLYGFIRGAEGGRRWLLFSWLACLLGMGTKEVMVSAPVIVFLYDRTFVAGSFAEAWRRRRSYYAALAATWIPLLVLVLRAGSDRGGEKGFDIGVPWTGYWLTQFQAIARYLKLAAWPSPLVFDYGIDWPRGLWPVLPPAALVVALAALTLVGLRRWPAAAFLGVFFFAILAPTSVIPGSSQMTSEHRMYLPLAAVLVAVFAALRRIGGRMPFALAAAGVLAAAGGLTAATLRRNQDYRSPEALWQDTVAKRPDNYRARYDLGNAYLADGQWAEAAAAYEGVLRIQPDSAKAHNNLGNALAKMGRLPQAIDQYGLALGLDPENAKLRYNLGFALLQSGRAEEAAMKFREALRLKPDYAEACANLGIAFASLGRLDDALGYCQQAVQLEPSNCAVRTNYGLFLLQAHREREAREQFEAALRLDPGFAPARAGLDQLAASMRDPRISQVGGAAAGP
jgi:tetratricopeptide (TPR) repeat protein